YSLEYTGLDADAGLLALAETQAAQGSAQAITCRFLRADLATPGWTAAVAPGGYDLVACLATLHHLPGGQLRAATVAALSTCVRPGGRLVFSVWQFADSPRLTARMAPWSAIGLSATDVEPGDALLPWDGGTHALRYVHMLSAEDLLALAAPTGLMLREQWRADGRSGDQTLYLLLERAPQPAPSLNTL
ncbi:MAG: class I SAM-dependent methyltransferase, partial [Caldilineaceae bacterium]